MQSGVIGNVSEVHVYQGSKWAADATPTDKTAVPEYFDYDLWLGPVPYREYHKDYHPASWRRYWAFGNGTIGDMEDARLIDEWKPSERQDDVSRRFYRLTPLGRRVLVAETERLERLVRLARAATGRRRLT